MKYRLIVLPAADKDVEDIAFFIAKESMDAALRFFEAVTKSYEEIRSTPLAWTELEGRTPPLAGLHKRGVKTFRNYLIFYRVTHDTIHVLRVLHGARDIPDVLQRELGEGYQDEP
jgi:toxin ParE1/3/4